MENKIYLLKRIEGEYAYLLPEEGGDELFIALALLPVGADEGDRLMYVFPDFKII